MRKTEIRAERVEAFFERGRKLARAADRSDAIPSSVVVAFVGQTPTSIGELARKLKRDRSAVSRDVQVLERFGVVQVAEKPLPGHGRQKRITPVAGEIQLTAVL